MKGASVLLFGALSLVAQPRDLAGWMAAIEAADRSVLAAGAQPPAGLVAELKNRLPRMKDSARVVAAQVLQKLDTAEGAAVLLVLVRDHNLSTASAASRALRDGKNLPPGDEILLALPAVASPAIRAHLFLAAGKAKAPLGPLRQRIASEANPEAKNAGLAAAVRLGGDEEREALAVAVRDSKATDVVPLMDLLVYTGDKRMGRALLPLFHSAEPVMRISPDPESRMARRSDLAVWTAHELGLIPQLHLTRIQRYDAATTRTARDACAKVK